MATLSVLYFFDVKKDQEQVFIENWTQLTALIYEYQGSLGSRLHKTEDGRYITDIPCGRTKNSGSSVVASQQPLLGVS